MKYLWSLPLYLIPFFGPAQEANGFVLDAADDSPLPFAHVLNTTHTAGSVTDHQGAFSVRVTNPTDQYKISYIGYETMMVTGRELLNADTIRLRRQMRVLNEVNVRSKQPSAMKMLMAAYRRYKDMPSTTKQTFKGYYEEVVVDTTHVHRLTSVFVVRGYDNQGKGTIFNWADYTGDFVILGLKAEKHTENPSVINGLRWVSQMTQVRNQYGGRADWDDAVIDSVTTDGTELNYWISVYSKKWGPRKKFIITDSYDILVIEELGSFCSRIIFDPQVSYQYPVYSYSYLPGSLETSKYHVAQANYYMLLLEELPSFDHTLDQVMPGEKIYHKDNKSMWQQTPLYPNFDWTAYENIRFPD